VARWCRGTLNCWNGIGTNTCAVFKPKTVFVLAGSALWLAGLGWIDRATGYELGLFAFYTAPVAVVAWNLGQTPGIIVAFGSKSGT